MQSFAKSFGLAMFVGLALSAATAEAGVYGGTIDSVTADRIVIKLRSSGKTKTFRLSSGTRITLGSRNSSTSKLKPGMSVSITTLSTGRVLRVKATRSTGKSPATRSTGTPLASKSKPAPLSTTPSPAPVTTSVATGDWPQFRGPARDNISRETGLLKSWPASGPQLAWTADGFGEGFSAVSIVDGKIFTMGTQGNNHAVFARDLATGRALWTTRCGAAFREGAGNGPRSTPTVDGGQIYALGGAGDLSCLDAQTGRIVWQKNILREFGGSNITWGICESVLIDGDKSQLTLWRGVAMTKDGTRFVGTRDHREAEDGERAGRGGCGGRQVCR